MRNSVVIIVVCVLIIGLIGLITFSMHKEAHEMIAQIQSLLELIEAGKLQTAQEQCGQIFSGWKETEKAWQTVVSHAELQEVTNFFTAIQSALRFHRQDLAHTHCAQLIEMLISVDAELFPHFGNVF